MNDITNPVGNDRNHVLLVIALLLFLAGLILPILCWAFWLPKALLFVACGAEGAAFLLALLSWQRWLSKVVAIGTAGFCLLGVWLGWNGFPTYQMKIHPTAPWMNPLASRWVLQSPGASHSIGVSSEIKRNGEDSLRFELRPGETWVDQTFIHTFRAEIATKEFAPINSVIWYAFSVYFPTNFPMEDQWLSFAQWKSSESLSEGANRKGQRPVLRFGCRNGRFDIVEMHNSEGVVPDGEVVPEGKLFKKSNFRLGMWHDFVIQVKWSCKDDGFINIWWNGKQIVEYHGPVGCNVSLGPQFKFGLYHDDSDKTYIAYFNHVKSGNTPQDVDFDPGAASRYSEK